MGELIGEMTRPTSTTASTSNPSPKPRTPSHRDGQFQLWDGRTGVFSYGNGKSNSGKGSPALGRKERAFRHRVLCDGLGRGLCRYSRIRVASG